MAAFASLIFIIHLKKKVFFLHPAPLLKQGKHRGTVRKCGIRTTCLLTSSETHLILEIYIQGQKLFLSESAKTLSVISSF